jgi:hypothetical protein
VLGPFLVQNMVAGENFPFVLKKKISVCFGANADGPIYFIYF